MLLYPIMMIIAIPLAIGSLFFLLPMSITYCFVSIIRCIPVVSKACDVLGMLSTAAGCFGFEQWRDMLRENCEANRKREIALAQAREEVSERDRSSAVQSAAPPAAPPV
ncbi:unnamed protein product [Gongylonema pulchrum]|uniref:Oleosin n=1 Tax=Gongylonema pulchrum TaxID=637853 RepID=A0A183E406_9BILA|nr:unnamed protein product [Gongylonema pulchrum]